MAGYDVKKYEAYFRAAWKNAVELCVLLCKEYGLTEKDIISHAEGNKVGIASNHSDIGHWFPKHGESMDSFRAAVKKALATIVSSKDEGLEAGDIVEIKASARTYYPGGPIIPSWVKWNYHLITQITQDQSGNKPVIKGGKECVLLGRTILKGSMDEKDGIMTWVDKDCLTVISSAAKEVELATTTRKYYRIQLGAFTKKENAEELLKKLKAAGFDGMIKYG